MPTKITFHVGPKGGLEIRRWTERGTFYTVSKYKVLHLLTDSERDELATLEASIKAKKQTKLEHDSAWRHIMRGGN